jgi:hypothetical protein
LNPSSVAKIGHKCQGKARKLFLDDDRVTKLSEFRPMGDCFLVEVVEKGKK